MRVQQQRAAAAKLHEKVLASVCDVCFISFNKPVPRQLDEGLEVLHCGKCHCKVHRCCYDFNATGTIINGRLTEFLCDRCKHEALKTGRCVVCLSSDGALKKLAEDKVVHVFCGLVHNEMETRSYYPSIQFAIGDRFEESKQSCEICGLGNAQDSCAEESCKKRVHAYCAKKMHARMVEEGDDEPKCWNHLMSIGNSGSFDLSDEVVPYGMFEEEVQAQLVEVRELGMGLEGRQQVFREKYGEYLAEHRKRKVGGKLRRGGFSYAVCELHSFTMYCFCCNREEDEMVLCECCCEWYHQKCVKYSAAKENEEFICGFCRDFYDLKRKIVEEVRSGRAQSYEFKAEMPVKVSIADLCWFLRVLDCRIANSDSKDANTKILKQLSKYPLKSSCIVQLVRSLSRNKFSALVEQTLIDFFRSPGFLEGMKVQPVLYLDAVGNVGVWEEGVRQCERVRKLVGVAEEVLQRRRVSSPFAALKAQLDFKASALTDSYEQIIELSKVVENYQEVPLLKLKANAYGYLETLKLIKAGQIVPFETLLTALAQASQNPHPSPLFTEPLSLKFAALSEVAKRVKFLVSSDPNNAYQIAQQLQVFANQKVEPPLECQQYKKQKAFLLDLFLYYVKSESRKMDEGDSLESKIAELLLCTSLKPTNELSEIVNNYKPLPPPLPWKGFPELLSKFTSISVEFELKEILKRKAVKQEHLTALLQKAVELRIVEGSEEIAELVKKWQSLQMVYEQFSKISLTDCDNITTLSERLEAVNFFGRLIQEFPVKLEDEGNRSWSAQAKLRKQELEQLFVLFTESQLVKNPLTLPKILHTISRNNPLVRNYYLLKKEQGSLSGKYAHVIARIEERLQAFRADPKKQRKEQIKDNNEKPTLAQITELVELLRSSKVDFSKEIRDLNKIMNNSLEIASKVKRYLEGQREPADSKDILAVRKEIDELRKKVLSSAELNLKTELVSLYHAEIHNRMQENLLQPTVDLEKISLLLKFADEEGLSHLEAYQSLKDRFETKSQRSKEHTLVKQYEQILLAEAAKDQSPAYANLYILRKNLPLSDLHKVKTKNTYLDELEDKNRTFRQKITKILQQKGGRHDFAEAKSLYFEALKNPIFLPDISALSVEISKGLQLLKRWRDLNKNYNYYHPIFMDFQNSIFSFEEIEKVKRELKDNEENIEKLNAYVYKFSPDNRHFVEATLQRIESSAVLKDTDLCVKAQIKYLEYWVKLLDCYAQKKQDTVPLEKLRKLSVDAYFLLQKALRRSEDIEPLKGIVNSLEGYLEAVKNELSGVEATVAVASQGYLAQAFIDVEDFCYELQTGVGIDEELPIYKPFNDILRFKNKNLMRVESRIREQESLSLKRFRSQSKFEDSEKLIQSSDNFAAKLNEVSVASKAVLPDSSIVSSVERKKIKDILLKNIQRNAQLKKYGDCENEVKMIENQIFGEWNTDIIKYFETSELFEKLFIKLVSCPHFSNKLIKKKFEFKFIQLMVTNLNKIEQLEAVMDAKAKEQEKAVLAIVPDEQPDKMDFEDEKVRLKEEMKLISKETKQKKKKKHRRSRSDSPDAKFSSEEEKELPSYIQNEYNREEKNEGAKRVFPLMYDPDEDSKEEVSYPLGSVLKLKDCELEMSLRKKGKLQVKAVMYSEQDFRKIDSQAVDPGFTRLSIRKDKTDSEIIAYINKSKKKYKYLVGWFEAVTPSENEYLRDLSIEANEKHKIFGWQNEHIKVHVMSIKQLVQIQRMTPPAQVSSEVVAKYLNDERMVFIMQFPQRIYQIRETYKPFANISTAEKPVTVSVPPIVAPIEDMFAKYAIPSMPSVLPPVKSVFVEQKNAMYETWEAEATNSALPFMPHTPIPPNNPFNIIRINLGFSHFSPIVSDEEDAVPEKEIDLADDLLNKINGLNKLPQTMPPPREKQYPPNYASYPYPNRPYNVPPSQPVYSHMPQQIYNPMANKYPLPTAPRNPMSYPQPAQPPQARQPYYDPRYHNYPQ